MYDQVLCINLDRRPERWEAFCDRLPRPWPWGVPQRFSAADGLALYRQKQIPPRWTASPGAYGCYLSHLAVLERTAEAGESALIFEDDCLFRADFAAKAAAFLQNVPADWHQLYFGGQHGDERRPAPPVPVAPGVCRCVQTRRTHAYAVSPAGAPLLLDTLRRGFNHVDVLYLMEHRRINAYCPDEWMCGQAAGVSDIFGFNAPVHLPDQWWQRKAVAV